MCRSSPSKPGELVKLSGGILKAKAWHFAVPWFTGPSVFVSGWSLTTGVDYSFRKEFWDMLKRLKAQGTSTFLVSTPYMDEADTLWAELPDNQEENSCPSIRPRRPLSSVIPEPPFAVRNHSKKWVCSLEDFGKQIWPKVALCFWGVSSPHHSKKKFTGNQQLLLKALEMLGHIPWS